MQNSPLEDVGILVLCDNIFMLSITSNRVGFVGFFCLFISVVFTDQYAANMS